MRIKLLLLAAMTVLHLNALGQYETVVFNYDKSYFNEGRLLPAEQKFMVTGEIPRDVQIVELKIFQTDDINSRPVHSALWKRHPSNTRNTFTIPVNYSLRGNEKYTFLINYYKPASAKAQESLLSQLSETINGYVDQSFIIEKTEMTMRKHPRMMASDLNSIINEGLYFYRNRINFEYHGLSDIVLDKLYQIRTLNLKKARFNVFSKKDSDPENLKLRYAREQLEVLKELIHKEISQYANMNLLVVADSRKVSDYATEKTRNVLSVNLGYAGVYNEGNVDDFSSAGGLFAGVSLPLGKAAFTSPFWSKTSISVGVFIDNLEFSKNDIATGPIVDRPLYFGLGYKALPFIRLNAGMAVLQSPSAGSSFSDFDKVYLRPFVGLSLEFDLWIGLNK
ncbi:MAG: hypothetical protein DWQ48_00100 [Bacteroidetes bacterium]|nr:MAG: hypothetical protein DWQ48_00100 [Bacteroidota bacterium]